ncbi:hypothetical protein BJ994_000124 [Arthrobacter pigmenti]|uniref:Uncharacterized protein n=1 Tax=Arthrobacter pigmenti TaxID=271432 RepID=A0A846RD66_9MICC|nr:hypothetical protein [Arthrobacter pigmenti]NJC21048.1 hypothetical protein [Arthrobacter pigmenti]
MPDWLAVGLEVPVLGPPRTHPVPVWATDQFPVEAEKFTRPSTTADDPSLEDQVLEYFPSLPDAIITKVSPT